MAIPVFEGPEEEQRFWEKLAHSEFWTNILSLLEQREDAIHELLEDPRVPRTEDPRLLGRLAEVRWFKKLPSTLITTVQMNKLVVPPPEEVGEEMMKRHVGIGNRGTGLL
jgi:hypothetical protein